MSEEQTVPEEAEVQVSSAPESDQEQDAVADDPYATLREHYEQGELTDDEIDYYITHYRPFDKAGAYGIQEWIGYVGVTSIHGSYYNVMGLPVQRIYQEILEIEK